MNWQVIKKAIAEWWMFAAIIALVLTGQILWATNTGPLLLRDYCASMAFGLGIILLITSLRRRRDH